MGPDCITRSLFATLSHGGQEVVHSDFLYFLGKNRPDFFKSVLKDVGLDNDYSDIEREYKKMDISFFKEGEKMPYLVIENKVKSLPTDEQIDKYKKTAPDAHFVFLSLFGEDLNLRTPLITYKDFIAAIERRLEMLKDCNCRDNLIYLFTKEYVDSFNYVTNYIKGLVPSADSFNSLTVKEYFHFDKNKYEEMKSLRLDGLIKKLRMYTLMHALKSKLLASNLRAPIETGIIHFGSGISNSKPLIDCWFYTNLQNEGEYRYIIQLDNGYLNHGVIVETEEGNKIKIYKKSEKDLKAIQKKSVANHLLTENSLEPLKDICRAINPSATHKIRSYNNMFYTNATKMPPEEFFRKNISEALNTMAEIIISTYNKLITNHISSHEEKFQVSI